MLTRCSSSTEWALHYVQVAGAPIAAMLLSLNGVLGLRGWKWLFLLEGLPTIAFGFILRVWLTPCSWPSHPQYQSYMVASASTGCAAALMPQLY